MEDHMTLQKKLLLSVQLLIRLCSDLPSWQFMTQLHVRCDMMAQYPVSFKSTLNCHTYNGGYFDINTKLLKSTYLWRTAGLPVYQDSSLLDFTVHLRSRHSLRLRCQIVSYMYDCHKRSRKVGPTIIERTWIGQSGYRVMKISCIKDYR